MSGHVRSNYIHVDPSRIWCFRMFRSRLSSFVHIFSHLFFLQPTTTKAFDPAEPRRVAAGRAPHESWPHLPWCCGRGGVHAAPPWLDAAAGAMEKDVVESWDVGSWMVAIPERERESY